MSNYWRILLFDRFERDAAKTGGFFFLETKMHRMSCEKIRRKVTKRSELGFAILRFVIFVKIDHFRMDLFVTKNRDDFFSSVYVMAQNSQGGAKIGN